jgi:hypothetical protein
MRRGLLLPLTLIPLTALVVVLPLVVHGCSCGHDFDFHLISWMEAAAQFRAGVRHPAWAFSPAWNAGEPRFVFYPPVSWTGGALLGMVLPWSAVPIVYTWLALVGAGLAMYRLARELEGSQAGAAIAAAVYMANPYMIFTAYERTAYAELLAAAWIPLLLEAILRERVTVLRVAVPVALLWLTNAPAAVMGCYALAVLTVVRLVLMVRGSSMRDRLELTGRVAGGVALGLGLAAFYVVPAAYERRWVQIAMAMVEGMRIQDNFLFHRTSDALHDEVLHTASVIAVGMLAAAVVVLVAAAFALSWTCASEGSHISEARCGAPHVRGVQRRAMISIAVLATAIAVLLTPLSASVWRVAPEMAFLQFPWRLIAILAAAVCAAISIAAKTMRMKPVMLSVGAVALVAAMSWPLIRPFWQACDDEDNVAARRAVFVAKTGTDATDEYTTGEADNDALAHANPAYWLAEDGDAQPVQSKAGQVPMHFAVDADRAEELVLNLREYPAWVVRVNGAEVKDRKKRADGLIALPVGAGRAQIDIAYTMTSDRKVGDGISLLALCGALGLAGMARVRRRSRIIED